MDYQSRPVSLKKTAPQPWTDPVTGEIYPGGDPNAVSQPISPQNAYQPNAFPNNQSAPNAPVNDGMKFCKYCGQKIHMQAVVCTHCGRQVEQLQAASPLPIIINNNNVNNNVGSVNVSGRAKSKWIAFVLCFFFGVFGVHRFYEGKIATGLLWLFTFGFFGIGWFVDLLIILTKSDPYYV